jgi:hypothetical protein
MAVAGVLTLGGCDATTTQPVQLAMESDVLLVAVSPSEGSANPLYSWNGARARLLEVTGGSGLVWRLQALDDDQGFPDPVRHGVLPAGATQNAQAALLDSGVRYRLRVVTIDGDEGTIQFTP